MARFSQSIKGVRIILKTMPGFILRQTPYRNADTILTVLTAEGFLTIQANGALKMTSPFQAATTLGAWTKFTVRESRSKGYLEKAELIQFAPLPTKEGMLATMMMEAILQVILFDESDTEGPTLYAMLSNLRNHWETPQLTYLRFLLQYLKLQGIPLIVDYCVQCQSKKQIVGVSQALGGFICQGCIHQVSAKRLSAKALTLLRSLQQETLSKTEDVASLNTLINVVHDHVRYHLDTRFIGFDNIESILSKIHS
ncbi:MAG: DNA repair protein RecO [Bacilli bacterium]